MLNEKYNVVIGGGIAGIVTAFLLVQKGKKVLLLETTDKLGGLLNSKRFEDNYFDYGTHLLRETGVSDLDDFLYGGLDLNIFNYIKSGSFYKSLFAGNCFISDDSFDAHIREEFFKELIVAASLPDAIPENLEEQLIQKFGSGYYKNMFKGVIEKLFFNDPVALCVDSHMLFGLSRLIAVTSEKTNVLKRDNEKLDAVLGYHSYKQGVSDLKSMYPKYGGAGAWISHLEIKLMELDVQIIKNAKFSISFISDYLNEIHIEERIYKLENIYWTVPPIFLFSALGVEKPNINVPQRLTSVIVDVLYEGDYLTDLFYVTNFDPGFKSWRITLYDNFNHTQTSWETKRITVEFLFDSYNISRGVIESLVKKELLEMKIVNDTTKINVVNISYFNSTFPVPTPQFKKDSDILLNEFRDFQNLTFFGKASGKNWFMNDVILEIHNYFK